MHGKGILARENEADEDIDHQHQNHVDKGRAWNISKAESLQAWFTNQGLEHLWSGSAAASEETLLLLASEKQWDDVREICCKQLNVPTVQIGYLKAYLINKVNSRTNSTKTVAPLSCHNAHLFHKVNHRGNDNIHLCRFLFLSILTLIIMIVSVAGNNLSYWSEQRSCSNAECGISAGTGGCHPFCGTYDYNTKIFDHYPSSEANGQCGWRTGKFSWIQPSPPASCCPFCDDSSLCPECRGCSDEVSMRGEFALGPLAGINWESEYNFKTLCNDYDDEAACLAMRIGNVYMAFTVFAIVFNVFAICLMVFFESIVFSVVCGYSFCDDKTRILLGILYGLTSICNFIAIVVWMAAGVCDDADPNLEIASVQDTVNYPGYSLYGLMICVVANMIGCGCVYCAKRTDQKNENENDQEKNDTQREDHDETKMSPANDKVEEPRPMELAQVQNEVVELQNHVLEDQQSEMPVQPQPEIQVQPSELQPNDHFTHQ